MRIKKEYLMTLIPVGEEDKNSTDGELFPMMGQNYVVKKEVYSKGDANLYKALLHKIRQVASNISGKRRKGKTIEVTVSIDFK